MGNLRDRSGGVRLAIVVLLVGGALNGAAIAANGRMPFSVPAALAAGRPLAEINDPATHIKNEPASQRTRLPALGDIIPLAPVGKVLSVGDVALLIGIALFVAAAMRPR